MFYWLIPYLDNPTRSYGAQCSDVGPIARCPLRAALRGVTFSIHNFLPRTKNKNSHQSTSEYLEKYVRNLKNIDLFKNVAYNVSDTTNWKNGPVHTFTARVVGNIQTETDTAMYTDFRMLFTCRPTIEESTINCRVQNATIDNYEINLNNSDLIREENATVYDEIFPIDFHVEFDKNGVKNVTFPKPCGYFRENIIRSIIDNFNVGVDLSDKNSEHYVSVEKSINGECPTSFDFKIIPRQDEETSIEGNLDVINMTNTVLADLSDEQTLAIEKDRKMHKCTKKTPYIFGSDEPDNLDRKRGFRMELDIVSSRSKIYLGKNRFNSYSEHSGVLQMGIKGEYIKNVERMKMKGKTSMSTKLKLIWIDQATEE